MPSSMKPIDRKLHQIRSITLTGMLLAILVVQEEALVMLPQVQFTAALIATFAAVMPLSQLIILVGGYVFLDSLYMGSVNPIYMIPMMIAWIGYAIWMHSMRNQSLWKIVLSAFLFGFIYGWTFIPGNMILLSGFKVWPYLAADLVFEIGMAVVNAITVLVIYPPLKALLQPMYQGGPVHE